jgi:NarL family two-component system response regulator LiaR
VEGTEQIRVVIVDDHRVVRSGLSAFLEGFGEFDLVGEAENGREAVALCERLRPDVVLMDLVMPELDGAAATRALRERCPQIRVIALTSYENDELVKGALEAGAIGYLLKNVSADELAGAIRAARAGRPTLAGEAARVLIRATSRTRTPGDDLTAREREVLGLMAKGMSNNDIADRLVVERSTVKFHVSGILSKLGVESRTEAVVVALQHGLVR